MVRYNANRAPDCTHCIIWSSYHMIYHCNVVRATVLEGYNKLFGFEPIVFDNFG